MKAIFILFDSLNRSYLPPYGNEWIIAPNFERLAGKTVIFDNSYACSMPCMPSRRELHTGRYNFLHRRWGPLEPFDDSMPELLKKNGVYTHLISDHYHYWEDGGSTYHPRYSSWEIVRGQEGDPWKGHVKDPDIPEVVMVPHMTVPGEPLPIWRQDWVNREYMKSAADQPQTKTFDLAVEFIEKNRDEDNWFLQIESFDPHEPFFSQTEYKNLYPHSYEGPHFDWPSKKVTQPESAVEHMRYQYAALLSMCDDSLGRILDLMDQYDLWKDTMLIVGTDHGFLLGEHGYWAKVQSPWYNELVNTPLFCWDPRSKKKAERRKSLVQTIDWGPTFLEFFGVPLTPDMQGRSLRACIANDVSIREAGLFGFHGGHVNVTDGRYVYMRAPVNAENQPLYNYTLMPTHMVGFFSHEELSSAEFVAPFLFTKGLRLLRTKYNMTYQIFDEGHMLFDLKHDPAQKHPFDDPEIEKRMICLMVGLMKENDCPPEQYIRLGLDQAVDQGDL